MEKVYRIRKLFVWQGDHFYDSYKYKEIGFTDNKDLVDKFLSIKVGNLEYWPGCCMKNWPLYKVEPVEYFKPDYIIGEEPICDI